MLEPQSTTLFVLLLVLFAALMAWLIWAKSLVLRILVAFLAFIPAAFFGVVLVNKYYGYYQTWGSALADVTNLGGPAGGPPGTHLGSAQGVTRLLGHGVYLGIARQDGYTLRLDVHGQASHLTRQVYVYLPPQYFQPAYRTYRFPVVELIHGFPGQPQDWISVLDITSTLRQLISRGLARPAVLVMPDANGARGVSLQCLNQLHGPQDATFMAGDIPAYIAHRFRVWQPGRTWGIAGYSEGGFCAANLGLQYGRSFGFAGVLSGYFQPTKNQLGHPERQVSPFGRDRILRLRNTPTHEVLHLPPGAPIPQFWIGAGTLDPADARDAQIFRQLLQLRQPTVVLRLVQGGHTMATWRALVPPMLEWMTRKLASNVLLAQARARRVSHHGARPSPSASPGPRKRPTGRKRT
ncbi:MAG TPA: alpha/beta hydrolase-fold protein [Streptosporangiaceae bacterium]|nr:alpha/beta hydrolase-fold protein [Streptosporangiaceae bacterium]